MTMPDFDAAGSTPVSPTDHPYDSPTTGPGQTVRNPSPGGLAPASSQTSADDPVQFAGTLAAREATGTNRSFLHNGPWNAVVIESFTAENPRQPPDTTGQNQRPVPWIVAYIPSDSCTPNSPHAMLGSPITNRRDGTQEEQRIHWQSIKHLFQIGHFTRRDGDPQGHVPQQNDRVKVTFYDARNPGKGGHYETVAHSGYQSPTALPAVPDCEPIVLQTTAPSDASGNQSYHPRARSPITSAPGGVPRYVYGVDLAGHQDDQLSTAADFAALSETNSFAIIKQSQGSPYGEDPYRSDYNPDWGTWAVQAGMIVGYYHYATFGPYGSRENDIDVWIADGRAEAEHFISAISRGHPGHLPWAIDIEGGSQRTGNPNMSFGGHYSAPRSQRNYEDRIEGRLQGHARAYMQAFVDTLIQGGSPGGQVLFYGSIKKWERRFFGSSEQQPDFWNYLSSRGQWWSPHYGAINENREGLVSYNYVRPPNIRDRAERYRLAGFDAVSTGWAIWQFTSAYEFGGPDSSVDNTDRNIARTDYLLSIGVSPSRLIHSADADIEAGDGVRNRNENLITDNLLFT